MYPNVETIKQTLLMENEEKRLKCLECLKKFRDVFNNIVDELLKWEEEGFQDDREKTF